MGGSLKKIAPFTTKHFVRYSSHARYVGCSPLGRLTVLFSMISCDRSLLPITVYNETFVDLMPCDSHETIGVEL